jgi:RNA polymerase sigma factor (sigma-70 family)
MQDVSDTELLQQYNRQNSETAFEALVNRHISLVYSAALRKTANPDAAEEITQAVFIILAKKAGHLSRHPSLSGWLYQTTRLTAANYLRREIRRIQREQEAYMQSLDQETQTWPQIAPLLEDAMGRLNEKERHAVVMRFFEQKSFLEISAALGGSENAAKKRVYHGLEKLQKFFSRHSISSTTAAISETISANSIQLAPAALAKSVTAVAIAKSTSVSVSTLTLIKGTLKIMAWTKTQTTVTAAVILALALGTTTMIVHHSSRHLMAVQPSNAANPPLSQENMNRLGSSRQWSLECILYADAHQNQLPTNFDQLKSYAPKQGQIDSTNWEIVSSGNWRAIHDPAHTILLREIKPLPTSDGNYTRTYAFADGHTQIVNSRDRDFTAVEQKWGFLVQSR